jgi:hypothetical protein
MTAFSPSQLPPWVTTVEQLALWSAEVLTYLYPDLTAVESTGTATRVASSAPFYITADATPTWRQIARLSIPLNHDFKTGVHGQSFYAQPIGTVNIPAAFSA